MRAGTLLVDIALNLSRLQQDVGQAKSIVESSAKDIERAFQTAKSAVTALGGALSVGAFVHMVRGAIDAAEALGNLSEKTGMTVENLSALKLAAELGGVSFEAFEKGLRGFNISLVEAQNASSKTAKVLKAMGVDITAGPEQAFRQFADAMAALPEGEVRQAAAVQILKKAGDEWIPVLAKGAAGLDEVRDKAEALGLIVSQKFSAQSKEFNDSLKLLQKSSAALGMSIAKGVIEPLTEMSNSMLNAREQGRGLMGVLQELGKLGIATMGATVGRVIPAYDRMAEAAFAQGLPTRQTVTGRIKPAANDSGSLGSGYGFKSGLDPAAVAAALATDDAEMRRFTGAMQALEREYASLSGLSKVALVQWEMESGSLKDLTAVHKAQIGEKAELYDAYKRDIDQRKVTLEGIEAENRARTQSRDITFDLVIANKEALEQLGFEGQLVGQSTLAIEKMNAVRAIDLRLRQAVAALPHDVDGNLLPGSAAALEQMRASAEAQKIAVIDAIDARQKAERSWLTGARNGMHDYVELAQNTAAMSQRLFVDAFQGMEDALVRFVKQGKLDFRDLVDSIETDILRLVIRQQITGPLAQMVGGAFGSAGSLMPGFGALGASIGSGLGSLGFTGAAAWLAKLRAPAMVNPEAIGGYGSAAAGGTAGRSAAAGSGMWAGGLFTALAVGDYMSAQNGRDWLRTLYGGAPPMAGKINEKLGIPEFFTDPLGAVFGHGGGPKTPQIGVMQAGGRFWVGQSDLLSQQEADTKYAQLNALLNDPRRYDPSALMGLTGLIPGGVGMSADQMLALLTQHIAGAEQPDLNVLRGQRLSAVTQLKDLLGVDSLQQFRDNLKVSDLSTGSPMDQLGAARDTFQRDLSAVKFGDYSRLGAFQQEASQYLQLGRGVYASGQGYADIYAEVNSAIESVQSKTNEYLKDLPSTILQTSADQVAAIKAQTDELVTTLKDVGSKIDRLRAAGVE